MNPIFRHNDHFFLLYNITEVVAEAYLFFCAPVSREGMS